MQQLLGWKKKGQHQLLDTHVEALHELFICYNHSCVGPSPSSMVPHLPQWKVREEGCLQTLDQLLSKETEGGEMRF